MVRVYTTGIVLKVNSPVSQGDRNCKRSFSSTSDRYSIRNSNSTTSTCLVVQATAILMVK